MPNPEIRRPRALAHIRPSLGCVVALVLASATLAQSIQLAELARTRLPADRNDTMSLAVGDVDGARQPGSAVPCEFGRTRSPATVAGSSPTATRRTAPAVRR